MNLVRIFGLLSLPVISYGAIMMSPGNDEHHYDHSHLALRRRLPVIGNSQAKPGGEDLGRLSLDHWGWNLCGGDGNGGETDWAFFSPECADQVGVPDKYFFIAGVYSNSGGSRQCDVPKNKFVLVPIINTICYFTDVEDDCDGLTAEECLPVTADFCADAADQNVVTHALLDGEDVLDKVVRLAGGDAYYQVPCPDDWPIANMPADMSVYAVDGFWLVIPPLSKGEHTIALAGWTPTDQGIFALDFVIEVNAF
eukprot:scaffold106553_cov35-Cyclotella_meneghiniana.AAC.3